jgi:hypothetical protein
VDLMCPKCHAFFRKQLRYDAHVATCLGKVCKKCDKVGHLMCGVSISGAELLEQMKKANKPIVIHAIF